MDLIKILWAQAASHKLSAEEEDITKLLLDIPSTAQFFESLKTAELIILPARNELLATTSGLSKLLCMTSSVMPIPLPKRLSVSAEEISLCSSKNICKLLKKLPTDVFPNFKGVLGIEIGVSLNNSVHPGAAFWYLSASTSVFFKCISVRLEVAMTYSDADTLGYMSDVVIINGPEVQGFMSGQELRMEVEKHLLDVTDGADCRLTNALKKLLHKFPFSKKAVSTTVTTHPTLAQTSVSNLSSVA